MGLVSRVTGVRELDFFTNSMEAEHAKAVLVAFLRVLVLHDEIPLLRVTAVCARVGEVKGWVAGCAVRKGGKGEGVGMLGRRTRGFGEDRDQ